MEGTVKFRREWAVTLVIAAACLAALYGFPPDQYRLYPKCLLYSWTGWQCPGCGGLRAAHQLLHGHLAAAFQLNPLAVLLLPVAALAGLAQLLRVATGRDWLRSFRRPLCGWLLLVLILGFGILRNLQFG
jgi:hypothetical protein